MAKTPTIDQMAEALRLCVTNAETAARYASNTPKDTITLQHAPNWPGIKQARLLLMMIDEEQK